MFGSNWFDRARSLPREEYGRIFRKEGRIGKVKNKKQSSKEAYFVIWPTRKPPRTSLEAEAMERGENSSLIKYRKRNWKIFFMMLCNWVLVSPSSRNPVINFQSSTRWKNEKTQAKFSTSKHQNNWYLFSTFLPFFSSP